MTGFCPVRRILVLPMKKHLTRLAVFCLLFTSTLGWAQEVTSEQTVSQRFEAKVLDSQNDLPLENVHIINLNQVVGTVTDAEGKFQMRAAVNDTLYLTYLGYKPQKIRVTNDMLRFGETEIRLTELALALEEVIVRPYQLTGYLEIDVKYLPVNTAYQYSISGLNASYEAGNKTPSAVTKVLGAILNPADLLRNLFGKRPAQMRKLRKIKEDDQIRDLLASKFDRATLTELLQLDRMDIDDILINCNYSQSFIQTANDLQILDAISTCYEEYKVLNRR